MRYGHFANQDIPRTYVQRAPLANAWRLKSDFSKYTDDDEVIIFFADTPTAEPGIYWLDTQVSRRSRAVTAAQVLGWYLRIRDERYPNCTELFPGMPPLKDRRIQFQAWLRRTIRAAVPGFAGVTKVRPHGLRAGWVCDRRAQKIPDSVTMREGRWKSANAMGLYDRESFAAACTDATIAFIGISDSEDDEFVLGPTHRIEE